MSKTLILKNYQIKQLLGTKFEKGWLDLPLNGHQAKHRAVVFVLLIDEMNKVEDERQKLLEKYVELEENISLQDGVAVKRTKDRIIENGNYKLKDKDAFQKEYDDLMDRDAAFVITPENAASFEQVARLVRDHFNNRGFDYTEYSVYEEIAAAFKAI